MTPSPRAFPRCIPELQPASGRLLLYGNSPVSGRCETPRGVRARVRQREGRQRSPCQQLSASERVGVALWGLSPPSHHTEVLLSWGRGRLGRLTHVFQLGSLGPFCSSLTWGMHRAELCWQGQVPRLCCLSFSDLWHICWRWWWS